MLSALPFTLALSLRFAPMLAALTEADQPLLVMWIVTAILAIPMPIYYVLKIVEHMRGKTVDTSQFVTRSELAEMKKERDAEIKGTVGRIEQLIDGLVEDMTNINRAVGRLEGQLKEKEIHPAEQHHAVTPPPSPPAALPPHRRRRHGR